MRSAVLNKISEIAGRLADVQDVYHADPAKDQSDQVGEIIINMLELIEESFTDIAAIEHALRHLEQRVLMALPSGDANPSSQAGVQEVSDPLHRGDRSDGMGGPRLLPPMAGHQQQAHAGQRPVQPHPADDDLEPFEDA